MRTFVVETNIPVVANGDHERCEPKCRLACIDFLSELIKDGKIAVDLGGLIEEEYWNRVQYVNPGVGTRFLQAFFADAGNRVERIHTKKAEKALKFEGPLRNFDKSDRKFALVAKETGYTVVNAVDSDWVPVADYFKNIGVDVRFLCGCDPLAWFLEDDL